MVINLCLSFIIVAVLKLLPCFKKLKINDNDNDSEIEKKINIITFLRLIIFTILMFPFIFISILWAQKPLPICNTPYSEIKLMGAEVIEIYVPKEGYLTYTYKTENGEKGTIIGMDVYYEELKDLYVFEDEKEAEKYLK